MGYNIASDKRLKKFVEIKDKINDTKVIHNLIILHYSKTEKMMEFYHKKIGHKIYLILHEKNILVGYYWKNITVSCKNYVKNCEICIMKNKSTFIPPPCNEMICSHPRELYYIDITNLSS